MECFYAFSQELWQRNLNLYQKILDLPFNQELANGTLDKEAFLSLCYSRCSIFSGLWPCAGCCSS